MARGGARVGSGRKKMESRETADRVRAASAEVDNLQPRAVNALAEGLTALNDDGSPDHSTRIRAAGILLNKRIPDLARNELTGKDGQKLEPGIIVVPATKAPGEK